MRLTGSILLPILLLAACKNQAPDGPAVQEATFRRHVAALSDDSFLGRKPFTAGETKTVDYLVDQVKQMGLQPGNGDSYTQDVPMVEITGKADPVMRLEGTASLALELGKDYVGYTQRVTDSVRLAGSELVFCGYGIVAPEYGWNDYAGLDMKGKTAIVLVNDPGLGSEDSTFFKGNTMTYYGRWTYKYEEAARQGADAIFIVHETTMAGYPWAVVQGMGNGAKLDLESLGYTPCVMQGWLSLDAAKQVFSSAGLDLQQAMMAARKPGFQAMPLPYRVSCGVHNQIQHNVSKNVIALRPGKTHPDEYIIYSAHWDHLGVGIPMNGDSIYNGAVDNASGSAALLSIAEAVMAGEDNDRTIVFLWVTAEEQGLLGSAYYASNPVFSPAATVANLNMDGLTDYGPMKDFSVTGYGQSEMQDYAVKWAATQGRYIMADPEPQKGYFFRSDHFHFAKIGIPALYGKGAYELQDGNKEKAKELADAYRAERYHQPSDEYDAATYRVGGMLQDADLFYLIGKDLANSEAWPKWYEGSEFKAARDAQGK